MSVTYLLPAPATPITLPVHIAAESRLTIPVDNIPGLAATDVSASIVSDVPILVERAMYMDTANPPQVFGAGHAGSGVTAANPRWFLAEGATGGFFDMYYLIANPSTQATTVRVTYLLPNGAPLEKDYAVAAAEPAHDLCRRPGSAADRYAGVGDHRIAQRGRHRRRAIDVVARRGPLDGGPPLGRIDDDGAALGSGRRRDRRRRRDLRAHRQHLGLRRERDGDGAAIGTMADRPPARPSRSPRTAAWNVPMSQLPGLAGPGGTSFGVLIVSDGPQIVIERATYMDFGGIVWAAGHASLGTPLP